MPSGETRKVLEEYEFGNTPMTEILADNAEYTLMATGQTAKGREAVLSLLKNFYREAFSNTGTDVRYVAADEEKHVGFIEFTFKGTHTGEFLGIKPTQRTVELQMLNAYEVENGKIQKARIYFDMGTLLRQLGPSSSP